MNRGVLRGEADFRNEDGAALLWTGTTSGVQVTPIAAGPVVGAPVSWPASANTLTSWTEITSSSPFACCAIDVYMRGHQQTGQDTSLLIDIGTGSGGSETVLIDGIPLYGHSRFLSIRFPVRVAASTRFAFRCQATTAAGSLTTPADPTVALGFIRDIPEFPAGTSVTAIGSIERSTGSLWNAATTVNISQRRATWAMIGDVPTGKMIYAIPMAYVSAAAAQNNAQLMDVGWDPSTGVAFNTAVAPPQEVIASDVFTFTDTSENWNPVIPTVWFPDGYVGGSVSAALDTLGGGSAAARSIVVFAVME